jgi:hypothetical protein
MDEMNLPKIGRVRSAFSSRTMFNGFPGMRIAFHTVTRDESDHELIRLAHGVMWAGAYRDDYTVLHIGSDRSCCT